MAADEVRAGNVTGKAEVSAWIARRANVTLGDEWDRALQICAEYLEAAGETPEEIVRALNEIAGAIGTNVQEITHIVETAPAVEPGETVASEAPIEKPCGESEDSPGEQAAAEPPGENENTRNCPNGTCPGTVRNYQRWGWYWW